MTSRCLSLVICVGMIMVFVFPASAQKRGKPLEQEQGDSLEKILSNSGIQGGLIVHLGCGGGKETANLRFRNAFVVHGLDTDPANVRNARKLIREKGLYGPVSIDRLYGNRLPYIDNLARAIVVTDAGAVSRQEIMRVLVPLGVAVIDGKAVRKPWPEEMGNWQQHFGDSGNNAVAKDTLVGPPRHYQWKGRPEWSRAHYSLASVSSMVSDRGRLFSIEDRACAEVPELPGQFYLVCRDAFTGIELWKHRFADWHTVKLYVKYTPVQLQRQLVVIGDNVFCTPGYDAPITVFDAESGKIIKSYDETGRTQEFVFADGILYVVIGDPTDTLGIVPDSGIKQQSRNNRLQGVGKGNIIGRGIPGAVYGKPSGRIGNPKSQLLAINVDSGSVLWRRSAEEMGEYQGGTLGVNSDHCVYVLANELVCVDIATGNKRWGTRISVKQQKGKSNLIIPGLAPSLVITEKAVYLAVGNNITAFSIKDGSRMWSGLSMVNHCKPADLFVVDDSVWTLGNTVYDAMTGEPKRKVVHKYPVTGHFRCYRNRITSRWYIGSWSDGNEFIKLDGEGEFPNPWGRSTCGMGHLPCNGLLYLGPSACACANMVQLTGFNALYTDPNLQSSDQDILVKVEPRLEKGPAYRCDKTAIPAEDTDWPTYRCNVQRGGCTKAVVSPKLKPAWKSKLTSRPSAPVIADGKVFVADVDAHTVYALDAEKGEVLWSYVAAGRVDSPPTFYRGTVLFGSRDGWVYCLRADDGELAWRFKALPDRYMCAYQQLESVWPVFGSILIKDGAAYFAAGRNSFLDGGIFLFALDPGTGKVISSTRLHGPYGKDGFPVNADKIVGGNGLLGNKNDVMVADGDRIYLRHNAFNSKLEELDYRSPGKPHLIASNGFLESESHHRNFWALNTFLRSDGTTSMGITYGDMMLVDGEEFFSVYGYRPNRRKYSDPLASGGYQLLSGKLSGWKTVSEVRSLSAQIPDADQKWGCRIQITGRAMVRAGNVLFVAGTPVVFPEDDLSKSYDGRMGGVLLAVSAADGKKLAEYKLDGAPAWDSLAAVENKLFICTTDGCVRCFSSAGQ